MGRDARVELELSRLRTKDLKSVLLKWLQRHGPLLELKSVEPPQFVQATAETGMLLLTQRPRVWVAEAEIGSVPAWRLIS